VDGTVRLRISFDGGCDPNPGPGYGSFLAILVAAELLPDGYRIVETDQSEAPGGPEKADEVTTHP
jgi:hypothetical protein